MANECSKLAAVPAPGAAACLFARAGADVTAVDLTEQAVEMTAANALAQRVRVDVRRIDAERLDLASGSYDFVFSWGVLHHSHDPLAAFREVSRVLVPGGRSLVMVYNRWSLRFYGKGLYWLAVKGKRRRGETLDSVPRHFTDGYYHRHFSPPELRRKFIDVGLRTTAIHVTHMAKQMVPLLPGPIDELIKRGFGWLLVAELEKT